MIHTMSVVHSLKYTIDIAMEFIITVEIVNYRYAEKLKS